jgi:DNA-binding YbaB/EbfC family protein
MINIQKMMKQAQQVQFKLQELQEKFKDVEVQGEAGGGAVRAVMNCAGDILGLTIDPAVINPAEKETLEDLVVAALNTAIAAKDERVQQETKKAMSDLGLPEDAKLPF